MSDCHVAEEVINVGEEVVVGELVVSDVAVRSHDEQDSSSRVRTLPKNLIAPLPYRITRGGVSEACCLTLWCTPGSEMGKR